MHSFNLYKVFKLHYFRLDFLFAGSLEVEDVLVDLPFGVDPRVVFQLLPPHRPRQPERIIHAHKLILQLLKRHERRLFVRRFFLCARILPCDEHMKAHIAVRHGEIEDRRFRVHLAKGREEIAARFVGFLNS